MEKNKYISLIIIFITIPFLLWSLILLLPTFDDWTYITYPNPVPFSKLDTLLPYGSYWRPFDGLFGYILGKDYSLFPTLNHIFVLAGHIGCTLIVFKLTEILKFNTLSRNISTLFFYFSPAMLGTVLGIDSLNQTYSNFWGLLGTIFYLKYYGKNKKYILWIICIYLATLSKENGLTWTLIPPIIAFSFKLIDYKTFKKDIIVGLSVCVVYFIVRLSLPQNNVEIFQGYISSLKDKIKNIAKFISLSVFAIDFVSLFHRPSRNWTLVFITACLSFPFLYELFIVKIKQLKSVRILSLILCLLIAESPHLLTLFTTMHAYAGLGMTSLIIGYISNTFDKTKVLKITFIMYLISAIFTDIHHIQKSYESGLIGKKMAIEAIQGTGKPVNKVYLIIIDYGYPKYSSFCVIPSYAFGWGRAAMFRVHDKWPKDIKDTMINQNIKYKIPYMSNEAMKRGYDCVWVIDHSELYVIKKKGTKR